MLGYRTGRSSSRSTGARRRADDIARAGRGGAAMLRGFVRGAAPSTERSFAEPRFRPSEGSPGSNAIIRGEEPASLETTRALDVADRAESSPWGPDAIRRARSLRTEPTDGAQASTPRASRPSENTASACGRRSWRPTAVDASTRRCCAIRTAPRAAAARVAKQSRRPRDAGARSSGATPRAATWRDSEGGRTRRSGRGSRRPLIQTRGSG